MPSPHRHPGGATRSPAGTPSTPPTPPPPRRGLLLAVVLTAQLMVVLDGTIVNVALPGIQRALHFDTASLSWVVSAYALTFGGLLLLGARCGDLFGRRRSFLMGIAVFTAGSLTCGLATTGGMLVAARALQGAGGAIASPAVLALLMGSFAEGRARMRAVGTFAAVSVAGAATGLLAGGVLTQLSSWRWVFFVNLPIGASVLIAGALVIAGTGRQEGRFDLLGALSSTGGVACLVYGFVRAGAAGWLRAETLVAFATGAVLLVAFAVVETRAGSPLLPWRLLADPRRSGALVARSLVSAGAYGMFFFLVQYLQDVHGYSPLEAGVAFLPIPAAIFASSQLTTRVLVERLPGRLLLLGGLALALGGMVVDSMLTPASAYGQLLASMLLFGVGNGISFVLLTNTGISGVAPGDAAAASGLLNVTQQLGAALGVAILVSIFGAATGGRATGPAGFSRGLDHVFAGAAALVAVALVLAAATAGSRLRSPAGDGRVAAADASLVREEVG